MIKKLRIKLIGIAMLSVAVVLATIFTAVNIMNFAYIANDADNLTQTIFIRSLVIEPHGSERPEEPNGGRFSVEPDKKPPAETRYFVVTVSGSEFSYNLDFSDTEKENATQMALGVLGKKNKVGYYGNYRYRKVDVLSMTVIVFLDRSQQLSTAETFLVYSIIIALVGLLIIFAAIVALSSKIVKPIADNYEKQRMFITDAGHELKTPLTIISANNELIALEYGENDSTRAIEKQVERMNSLVKNLTALAKIEEGGLLVKNEFSLSGAFKEVAENYEAVFEKRGISVEIIADEEVNFVGDENLFRQLFAILFDNVAKYSVSEAKATLKKVGGKIRINVQNDAACVKDGDMKEVFERFYRSAESRASGVEGSGIGLSAAREIVALHGGKISACGKDGKFNIDVNL